MVKESIQMLTAGCLRAYGREGREKARVKYTRKTKRYNGTGTMTRSSKKANHEQSIIKSKQLMKLNIFFLSKKKITFINKKCIKPIFFLLDS